ncbi:hypothetical protein CPB83DRAFT_846528 [Crepidotus variabilis]|uniref:Uncharacterized protein n=1 Tax=Crepidotus variabilis TaxID=179855 RepID=A0A9P6JTX5_9AGAR|nr:hypothetical protein CPB83DRAFT_846528 [Crepidotus variabilis]
MAEYTTSSQAYREYMSSRERTAYWIQSHAPYDNGFYSPSVPPSVMDGRIPSRPPSDAGSTNSTPPKMVLRYNDGRPDIPIPHPKGGPSLGRSGSTRHQDPNHGRSRTLSYNHGMAHGPSRSGSSGGPTPSPLRHDDLVPPEEIRILPSFGKSSTATSSRPNHTRSRSVPRPIDRDEEPELPFIPPPHLHSSSPYRPSTRSPHHQVSFAPPAPPHQPWHRSKQSPAAYSPHQSQHSQRPGPGYPAMLNHPPHVGPNGVIYSHSAPLPGHGQYAPQFVTPFPTMGDPSHRHASSRDGGTRGRELTRSLTHSAQPAHHRAAPGSPESLGSDQSGTYYVQSHGQKVHVIVSSRLGVAPFYR